VSKVKLFLVLAFALALIAAAALGGGWKWRGPPKTAGHVEHLAGWTWTDRASYL
jgi:hypothetical protein